jgi:hypothetical protein
VANIELRISPRIFEKIWNDPNSIITGLGETDSRKKFATGVVDTGGAPWLANISTTFRKNLKRSKRNTLGWGGNWFMKKTRSKKSRDTVPLNQCRFETLPFQTELIGQKSTVFWSCAIQIPVFGLTSAHSRMERRHLGNLLVAPLTGCLLQQTQEQSHHISANVLKTD